jgi:hypothetical protein
MDIDCPARGCPALRITMPVNFTPDDAADHHRPPPGFFSSDPNYQTAWNVPFVNEDASIAGLQCLYTNANPAVSCLPP